MAGTIGRVAGAAVSLYNENTLSLANLNFDFALVKLEAPQEFQELGLTISAKRKEDAESGALHQTARKLGALFEKVVPQTLALYRAYGTRVSEISRDPAVNPQKKEGIFAHQIGADSASIWAAATSGSGAIAVHLLGCMLARMFTGVEATSLWVELVARRKEQVRGVREGAMYMDEHFAASSAAQQEISRLDLGRWDNSARAWLQSGDQSKMLQHKQLMLILDNLNLPVNEDDDVFDSVIKAWCSAMEAMNSLLQGKAQRVQNGAVLLGMSSWHLYPDMTVLGDKIISVDQKDDLFQNIAILTIGLQFRGTPGESVSWSLPLACLQYYGDPVRAQRSVGQENARIPMEQFEYVVLGCVFAMWEDYGKTLEDGLSWLQRLEALLLKPTQLALANQSDSRSSRYKPWLARLCAIGARLSKTISGDNVESRLSKQLVELGRRRSGFISTSTTDSSPLFGLSFISDILPMIATTEQRIGLLREVWSSQAVDNHNYVIRYSPTEIPIDGSCGRFARNELIIYEYATVRPFELKESTQSTRGGDLGFEHQERTFHVRWLPVERSDLSALNSCNCKSWLNLSNTVRGCPYQPVAFQCVEAACSARNRPTKGKYQRHCTDLHHSRLWKRQCDVRSLGECCLPLLEDRWDLCSQLISSGRLDFEKAFELLRSEVRLQGSNDLTSEQEGLPRLLIGKSQCAQICWIGELEKTPILSEMIEPHLMVKVLNTDMLDAQKVFSYLHESSDQRNGRDTLSAFVAASEIYSYLPHATISTSVLTTLLCDAKWNSEFYSLSFARVFACLAMFDTGTINVDPDTLSEVFAMSSGNSIYVASVLVEDPAEEPNVADIRHIVGNIGQPGISFLVPPPAPKTRGVEMENWMQISHHKFDGNEEDNFQHTTVHLSFTNYEMPLKTQQKDRPTIDHPTRLVETLMAVHDRGRWIADLNFLAVLIHQAKLASEPYKKDWSDLDWLRIYSKDFNASVIYRSQCYSVCSSESSNRTFQESLEQMQIASSP